jgi:hypothetical protein
VAPTSQIGLRDPARGSVARIPAQRVHREIPVQDGAPDDVPISAIALLRREGRRVPHGVETPDPKCCQAATPAAFLADCSGVAGESGKARCSA